MVNTHLVYNPKQGHVKLFQITKLLAAITEICEIIKENEGVEDHVLVERLKNGKTDVTVDLTNDDDETDAEKPDRANLSIPTILAGDFNSCVNSGLWSFINNNTFNAARCFRTAFSKQKFNPKDGHLLSNTAVDYVNPENPQENEKYFLRNPDTTCINYPHQFLHNLNLKCVYNEEECENGYTQTDGKSGMVVDHIFTNRVKITSRLGILPKSDYKPYNLPGKKHGSDHMPVGIKFNVLEAGEI